MLSTHPDAFRRPSGLDRMEERPTSRSCVGCVVLGREGNGWRFGELGIARGEHRKFGILEVI